jgi:hypothetical protein
MSVRRRSDRHCGFRSDAHARFRSDTHPVSDRTPTDDGAPIARAVALPYGRRRSPGSAIPCSAWLPFVSRIREMASIESVDRTVAWSLFGRIERARRPMLVILKYAKHKETRDLCGAERVQRTHGPWSDRIPMRAAQRVRLESSRTPPARSIGFRPQSQSQSQSQKLKELPSHATAPGGGFGVGGPRPSARSDFRDRRGGRPAPRARRSEHVVCAGGGLVRAAGELRFELRHGSVVVAEASNQSTGYCPEPQSWTARAARICPFAGIFDNRRCYGRVLATNFPCVPVTYNKSTSRLRTS